MASPIDPRAILLSRYAAQSLLEAQRGSRNALEVSLDLNLSLQRVRLLGNGVEFPEGFRPLTEAGAASEADEAAAHAGWPAIRRIAKSANGCFLLRPEGFWKIQIYSPLMERPYSLMPTPGAPTVLNAGFAMHRIKGVTPEEDTRRKLAALGQVDGRVLDTSTGLGYTAIAAARQGARVLTIELDPAMLELAAYNPWSRELFQNAAIEQRIGDALGVAAGLERESFTAIIHDPPTASLAGDLYSSRCYRILYALLQRRGRLFHYVGNLGTRQGSRTARQVVRGLREAGFQKIVPHREAFGFTATR